MHSDLEQAIAALMKAIAADIGAMDSLEF